MSVASLERAIADATRPVELWWRDDDAGRWTRELAALLELARRIDLPLALAAVPAWQEPPAVEAIRSTPRVSVLQHGWDHANRAPASSRKMELVHTPWALAHRDLLRAGRQLLETLFADQFKAVLVPPWNRADPRFLEGLEGDYLGLSALGGPHRRDRDDFADWPRRVDVHVDVMNWRTRRFLGSAVVSERIAAAISGTGRGTIGIMTHHLEMTADDFAELGTLLLGLASKPQVVFRSVPELFGRPA